MGATVERGPQLFLEIQYVKMLDFWRDLPSFDEVWNESPVTANAKVALMGSV